MKKANATLLALLAGDAKQLVSAEMFTFTLVDGTVLRFTNADQPLTVGGNTFACCGVAGNPLIARDKISTELGTALSELDLTITGVATDLLQGQPWLAAITGGKLDYAQVLVEQFISSSWTDATPGLVWLFGPGRVADVELDRLTAKVKARNVLELLDIQMPRNLYSPGCYRQLYDTGCGAIRASFTVNGAVTNAVAPTRTAISTNLAAPNDLFTLGTLTFTSGALNGLKRTVRAFANANGLVSFTLPTAVAPANGDTFTIVPGCDKQQATCGTSLMTAGTPAWQRSTTEAFNINGAVINNAVQYTAAHAANFLSDGGVTFMEGGAPLTNVPYVPNTDPGSTNYMVNAGIYYFSPVDSGIGVAINIAYNYGATAQPPGALLVYTASGSTLTATGHGLTSGRAVKLGSTGTPPAPLVVNTVYFVIVVDANNFKLATTLANALAGTNIVLTTAGSGSNYVSESGKFANLQNPAGGGFVGHPYIPPPETSL